MSTTKKQLVKLTALKTGLSELKTMKVINTFFDAFVDSLIKDNHIELRGIGVFEIKTRKPKSIQNIATGKPTQARSYKDIDYKTSKTLKTLLNPKKKQVKPLRKKHSKP